MIVKKVPLVFPPLDPSSSLIVAVVSEKLSTTELPVSSANATQTHPTHPTHPSNGVGSSQNPHTTQSMEMTTTTALPFTASDNPSGVSTTIVTDQGSQFTTSESSSASPTAPACIDTYNGDCTVDFPGLCDEALVKSMCQKTCNVC